MSAVNTLRVEDATLHVSPSMGGYDLQVITKDGLQVVIVLDAAELTAAAQEACDMLSGTPSGFHAAGMRLSDRLNRIKNK